MTRAEYRQAVAARARAVSINRSNRLRGLPLVEVPAKPPVPMGYEITEARGDYGGTVHVDDRAAAVEVAENAGLIGYTLKRVRV